MQPVSSRAITDDVGSAPLSQELRRRTAQAHSSAEQSAYMTALVDGRVSREGLAALLARLLPVYEALERSARTRSDDSVITPFLLPGLARADRLRDDLASLTGALEPPASPAARAYAARVEQAARTSGAAYLAHHYTRYLGDLSGGQVIRAALERSLGVSDGSGASFFAFPQLRPVQVRKQYRELLDAAPFSAAQRDELVAEALVAYRLNVELVAELDADLERWTTP